MQKPLTLLLIIFSLTLVSAIGNTIPVQIQTTDALGNIQTGTYEFTLNISNSSTCSPVLYSNISNFTTDVRGIVSYDISVNLDFSEQYYLCYYRDGVSKENKTIGTNPYSFRANVSDHWDSLNTINSTQLEDSSGELNIKESWLTTFWDKIIGLRTTDNLTEGLTNLYDNQTWNESRANTLYSGIEWDYNQTTPAITKATEIDTATNTTMKTYVDGTFITQSNEGNLNVNKSNWWGTYNIATDLNNLITLDWANITNKIASDFNYLVLSKWENITGRPTLLSNFSDDLGNRGYTSVSNFTNNLGYYNLSDFSISNYYLKNNPFSFYNSTDFSITDYIPYTGANQNVNLGANNFSVDGSVLFVNSDTDTVDVQGNVNIYLG